MDRIGRFSPCSHGQDDGRRSCNDISSCPNSGFLGLSGFKVSDNVASLVQFKTRCLCWKKRIGACTNGHDSQIALKLKFRSFDGDRPAPSRFIRFSQLHPETFDAGDPAIIVS